ncbi:hypothetical protein GO730_39090 [Spirosoma sp. HMF3257]|uniref:Uncharacterized protein n=1 Tax=Spirosoma telluris TaxID=2183553 RepID=A0A327NG13_9BACT|nr:hypothetical protein [Spirosoma telluris]RAI72896.1 hypothetical protein HMF3257_39005 [Spirosoma telluris]
MDFKILYIEDQAAESREQDLINLGFNTLTYDPSSDISEVLQQVKQADINALILDYRLTAGQKQACFDAPTIAQTLRTKYSHDTNNKYEFPIILMSNEGIITDYYNDFTSQDLFDFTLTKKEFLDKPERFKSKLISFINSYEVIKDSKYDILKILGITSNEENLVHTGIITKTKQFDQHTFEFSRLIFEQIIRAIGPLIGKDVLAARLGVSQSSPDWDKLLLSLTNTRYVGILSDVYPRWWMAKINEWWYGITEATIPLRRLDAEERVETIKSKLNLDLVPIIKTEYSNSSNFWTICKYSNVAIDPFDGIELYKRDLLPWQEKEYISIETGLTSMDKLKDYISVIDKKAIRELVKKINANG